MSVVKRNLFANYVGQVWVAIMGLAFIPLYIAYLGVESYGLIGMLAMLQAWFVLLDLGMTPVLNREMARFTAGGHNVESIRDLLRSVEVLAFAVSFVIAIAIWCASGWLARDWLKPEALSVETVVQAFAIMGVVVALRFVEGIYRSCLLGLQRQVLFNVVNSVMATLRAVGAVAILAWVSPTIEAFFIWQGVVSAISLFCLAWFVYSSLAPADRHGRFSLQALHGVSRFAGGIMGITFLSLILMQIDKVLLSTLLDLAEYGQYMLASVVAGALYMVASPIGQAWLPRLTELHEQKKGAEFIRVYHLGAQLVSVVVGSVAAVLIVFADPVLLLWTRDPELVRSVSLLVSILVFGNLLNMLMWLPYRAQLASGWTSLAVRINVIAVLVIVPSIILVVPSYGVESAAWLWVCLNAGYLLLGVHFMYMKILRFEKWSWYKNDILKPIGAAFVVAISIDTIIPVEQLSWFFQVVVLILAGCSIVLAAGVAAPDVRGRLLNYGLRWCHVFKNRIT